jgi:UDP-N-acetylglucosamine transferase subunit ALG13
MKAEEHKKLQPLIHTDLSSVVAHCGTKDGSALTCRDGREHGG